MDFRLNRRQVKNQDFSRPGTGNGLFVLLAVFFTLLAMPSLSQGYNLETVLYEAIQDEDKKQIDALLKQGIDINKGNYLNLVALEKNRNLFTYLLEAGADINRSQEGPALSHEDPLDSGGKTPLCLIVSNFLSSKKAMETLHESDEWVEFLLANGADPNKKCYGKFTPLMMVSGKGADPEGLSQWDRLEMAMKIIVLLVKSGADLNASVEGLTAMDFANESRNLDLVMFLKSLGAAR